VLDTSGSGACGFRQSKARSGRFQQIAQLTPRQRSCDVTCFSLPPQILDKSLFRKNQIVLGAGFEVTHPASSTLGMVYVRGQSRAARWKIGMHPFTAVVQECLPFILECALLCRFERCQNLRDRGPEFANLQGTLKERREDLRAHCSERFEPEREKGRDFFPEIDSEPKEPFPN
jgi:hypothetical protein